MQLKRVLETVLYHASDDVDALVRFYCDVLELRRVGDGLAFRVGEGLLLLFDARRSTQQSSPPPHGASGAIHAAFVAAADEYERWKAQLVENGVAIVEEIEWPNGVRSFYFHDPAGNVLEITDGDLWPRG